ncbi:hypothetical protein MASR2M47_41850 [Draconibacterium sp.]
MNNFKIIILLNLVFCFSLIKAQEISNADAKNIAKEWIEKVNENKTKVFTIKNIQEKFLDDKLSYRAVNFNEGGFVVIGAENGLNPIIAYNKSSNFDENYLTQDEKDWFNFVEKKLANNRSKELLQSKSENVKQNSSPKNLKSASSTTSVPSLFETTQSSRWAGWYPYSIEMPYQNGANGCVPGAMAQIMKYYKFPLKGSGSHSYTWYDLSNPVTLSVSFDSILFDYGNMPFRLTYCGNGTNNCNEGSFDIIPGVTVDQMSEISKLKYYCGLTVNMVWQGQNTTGGGTYGNPGDWVQAMEDHFNYSSNWTYLNENYISQNHEAFKASLRDELTNGRPVLFAYYGSGYSNGHALVLDGYEDDDYFHFAFGRGGAEDTYYYLFSTDDDDLHGALPYTAYYKATIGIEPNCTTVSNLNLNNV